MARRKRTPAVPVVDELADRRRAVQLHRAIALRGCSAEPWPWLVDQEAELARTTGLFRGVADGWDPGDAPLSAEEYVAGVEQLLIEHGALELVDHIDPKGEQDQ